MSLKTRIKILQKKMIFFEKNFAPLIIFSPLHITIDANIVIIPALYKPRKAFYMLIDRASVLVYLFTKIAILKNAEAL